MGGLGFPLKGSLKGFYKGSIIDLGFPLKRSLNGFYKGSIIDLVLTQRTQYPLIKEYTLNYKGLHIMI